MLPEFPGIHPDICGKEGGLGPKCGEDQSPGADKALPGISGQDVR